MFLQHGHDDVLYIKTHSLLNSYKYKKTVELVVKTVFFCCFVTNIRNTMG